VDNLTTSPVRGNMLNTIEDTFWGDNDDSNCFARLALTE
jgi:hypothetical protein